MMSGEITNDLIFLVETWLESIPYPDKESHELAIETVTEFIGAVMLMAGQSDTTALECFAEVLKENKELMMDKPVIQPLAVDTKEAARLCGISERHFIVLDQEGLLGPRAVRLKSSVRWVLSELREWLNAGCPNREKWDQRKAEDRSAA